MQDQEKAAEELSQPADLHKEKASEALKDVAETPQYTERTPEEVGAPEQKKELHEVIKQNQEEIKRQEHVSEVAEHKARQDAAVEEEIDDADKKKEVRHHAEGIQEIDNAEEQIDKIVTLASSKDPYFAIKVAQHLDDNFVLDQVHDELIEDQVRSVLVEKGLLEEI